MARIQVPAAAVVDDRQNAALAGCAEGAGDRAMRTPPVRVTMATAARNAAMALTAFSSGKMPVTGRRDAAPMQIWTRAIALGPRADTGPTQPDPAPVALAGAVAGAVAGDAALECTAIHASG